jgi:hypothetical protein
MTDDAPYRARMSARRVELSRTPDGAGPILLAAASKIGKVKESDPSTRSLTMKARYGLNPVTLRANILTGTADTSVVEFHARGQDILGVASRTVIDRVVGALGE